MDKQQLYPFANTPCTKKQFESLVNESISNEEFLLIFEEMPRRFNTQYVKPELSKCYLKSSHSNKINTFNNNNNNNNNSNSNSYQNAYYNKRTQHFQRGNITTAPSSQSKKINYEIEANYNLEYTSSQVKQEHKDNTNMNEQHSKCKNINHLLTIVKDAKINTNKEFWYVYDDTLCKSVGMFTTKEIVDMYNSNKLHGDSLIRPCDMFKRKNIQPNEVNTLLEKFVKINQIDQGNILFEWFELDKGGYSGYGGFDQLSKDYNYSKKLNRELLGEKKVVAVNEKNVKEKEGDVVVNKANTSNNYSNVVKKEESKDVYNIGKKKKKKGKMVDLDVKTGFYTMGEQEKDYSEIYISGTPEQAE
jgi:hypothetical protein